ncbi:hypothetical protein PoB_003416100 [Plakobranchus ocellatus]|uniref:Uncharacterized protein n=1 Tax=Plakobranchus ocellatus TaxID=259542 RepID=A0AAV4AH73_9GAST|nr:hypothetical protein PoB_003416100 [Plakobranchus ocellatus]
MFAAALEAPLSLVLFRFIRSSFYGMPRDHFPALEEQMRNRVGHSPQRRHAVVYYNMVTTTCDLRLLGPPSGQGSGSGARTRDRRIPADLRADSPTTVPPTPRIVTGDHI